jgi:hypothetical protein
MQSWQNVAEEPAKRKWQCMEIYKFQWFDGTITVHAITFMSTFVGAQPISSVRRYDKKKHEDKQIQCPNVVQVYNQHMGGVDLLDSLVGLYRTKIRSRKWYHRVFFHLVDLMVVNAWLLYRRTNNGSKLLRLHDFKADIAEALCNQGKEEKGKRGRPSTSTSDDPEKFTAKRWNCGVTRCPQPCSDVRFDGIDHWPEWRTARAMCRMDKCCGVSRVTCSKCRVSLCHNSKKDCFFEYHHK